MFTRGSKVTNSCRCRERSLGRGVGKTTVAACVGSIFADLRQDDRVVAIDADTAFGKLGARVDPHAVGSYWDLAADEHFDTFADVRSRVGNNIAGLFVLGAADHACPPTACCTRSVRPPSKTACWRPTGT